MIRVTAQESTFPVAIEIPATAEGQIVVSGQETSAEEAVHKDFRIEKEDWNTYKLNDGTILKLRQVLVKVSRESVVRPGQPPLQVQSLSPLLMATVSPASLKRSPDTRQYTPQELSASIVDPNLKFKTIRAVVNEYVSTSGIKILLQLTPINIGKTSKFDASGYPLYFVNAQIGIQLVAPEKKQT